MPSPVDPNPAFQSQYPELTIPVGGFESSLPAHLLAGASDQMKYVMNEISRNSAATEFACRGAVDLSNHLRTLNGKTYRSERGIEDLRAEVAQLKADNVALKAQLSSQAISIAPITTTVANAKAVFKSKLALAILVGAFLFFLGYNRDQALALWQAIKS